MDLQRITAYLSEHEKVPKVFEQDYFKLAICEVILGNYSKANSLFSESITAMLGTNPYWRASGQPNWLVDIAILSGRTDLYPSVLEELTLFRTKGSTYSNTGGNSPLAHYCNSVMEILFSSSGNISDWIKDLKKRPKYKDLYAAGFMLQAILDKDQEAFTQSLKLLLEAYAGMAKHGELRLSPEGWLCLPAMTLAFLACQKGLAIEIENEYLSAGYLKYLLEK